MPVNLPPALTKNIRDLFGAKIFHVPGYQRPYAWTKDNCKDLWNDILDGLRIGQDETHFLGTVTLQEKKDPPSEDKNGNQFDHYDVVDGQQRLTTLYLLLLALARLGLRGPMESYLKRDALYRLEL